jgi:DNA invertase Pin-like site-specific DNA recombinase
MDLKAQQAAIAAFLQPIDKLLARPLIEIESGKNSDRPQLRAAMERCRKTGAALLIARLDRLARSVRFHLGNEMQNAACRTPHIHVREHC